MKGQEALTVFPDEYFVTVDKSLQETIARTITYLYNYGLEILMTNDCNRGRLKISFFDSEFSSAPEASGTMIIVFRKPPTRRPLRFYCLESAINVLMMGGVSLGVINEGIVISPVRRRYGEDAPTFYLKEKEPETIVNRLIEVLKNNLAIIDIQRENNNNWESLHEEVLHPSVWHYLEARPK